jgi:hypothetical protein
MNTGATLLANHGLTRELRSGQARQHRLRAIALLIVAVVLLPVLARAQGTRATDLRIGLGTFLSRDRGWNYNQPIELSGSVSKNAGSIDLEAGAAFSKSLGSFVQNAVFPPTATEYREGFRVRVGVRAPSAARSVVSALIGAELLRSHRDDASRETTMAGTAGIALHFGTKRRGTIDLSYTRFAKRLGSSRGILPVTLAWQI